MRRAFVEADVGTSCASGDPLQQFISALRLKYGGTEETENANVRLLETLLENGHLSKTSIVWHSENVILRIYGIKMNSDGHISYCNDVTSSPEKKKRSSFVTNATKVDFALLRNVAITARAESF